MRGLNQSSLASAIGVDRSTLSQLLSADGERLPRADTVAAIASVLQVSLDWLLGMSYEAVLGANILQESMQITPRTPVDEALAEWHQEAAGYKIRYVPTTLPDLAKTEEVMRHEFRDYVVRTADQAIAASQGKLDYTELPDTDMEICLPLQAMQVFAQGNGVWEGLSAAARRRQIDRMADIVEEQYPSLRIFLFDGSTRFSVPYTIFGPQRAAIYVGQMYFVFKNDRAHTRSGASLRRSDSRRRGAVERDGGISEGFAEPSSERLACPRWRVVISLLGRVFLHRLRPKFYFSCRRLRGMKITWEPPSLRHFTANYASLD